MIRHIVLFAFHPQTEAGEIRACEEAFDRLPRLVPGVDQYERGLNISPEDHRQGYTHCFQLTFASEKARDAYLIHPDHKAFGEAFGMHFKSVLVFDYQTDQLRPAGSTPGYTV